jgi:hypothetical protein
MQDHYTFVIVVLRNLAHAIETGYDENLDEFDKELRACIADPQRLRRIADAFERSEQPELLPYEWEVVRMVQAEARRRDAESEAEDAQ